MRSKMKLKSLGAVMALLVAVVTVAIASPLSYSPYQNYTEGYGVAVVSSVDSVILDGTVVMVDTTTAATSNIDRFAVKTWDGGVLNRPRILGLAWGNIPRSSSRQAGKVLIVGYHASARMSASVIAANTLIKTAPGVHGRLAGALANTADTLALTCGVFISSNAQNSATNARAKVIITRPLGAYSGVLN